MFKLLIAQKIHKCSVDECKITWKPFINKMVDGVVVEEEFVKTKDPNPGVLDVNETFENEAELDDFLQFMESAIMKKMENEQVEPQEPQEPQEENFVSHTIMKKVVNEKWNEELKQCNLFGQTEDVTFLMISEINPDMWNGVNGYCGADEILISANSYKMTLSYPMKNEAKFEFHSKNGFTRREVLQNIADSYKFVYDEELKTSTIPVLTIEERKEKGGLLNRNNTNGTYGICAHDLEDLSLESLFYNQEENTLSMFIGS